MRIHKSHASNCGVYGVRKDHSELLREGRRVACCTVERLMSAEAFNPLFKAEPVRNTAPESGINDLKDPDG